MYQKHEIKIKKNTELLERYKESRKKSYEINNDECDKFLHDIFSEAELETLEKIAASMEFLSVNVEYYIDLLNLLSQFIYNPTASFTYGCVDENRPYASCKVDRHENDDEIHIVIKEYWNNRFELQCTNPLLNGGFSLCVDYDEVPEIIRFLYNTTQRHEYLQKKYAENHEKFGDCLTYNCISRYFDECENGEGAIGVFNHETYKYEMYGYGSADYGWGAAPMTGNVVDKTILRDNPDKIWYPTNPKIKWFYLYDELVELAFYDTIESVRTNEKDEVWSESFLEEISGYTHDMFLDGDGDSFFDDIEVRNLDCMCYLWEEDVYDGKSEQAELMERCNAKLTGREVLLLIETLEKANKLYIEGQKKSFEKTEQNYADYLNDMFCTGLLFCSDDNEVLYAEADSSVENGFRTGDIVLHYKKF